MVSGPLDPDTKLICSWLVGRRDGPDAMAFLMDLASRLRNRVQITTNGHRPYIEAVEQSFGKDVDYVMLIEQYGSDPSEERRFSPPVVLAEEVRVISGNPDSWRTRIRGPRRWSLDWPITSGRARKSPRCSTHAL